MCSSQRNHRGYNCLSSQLRGVFPTLRCIFTSRFPLARVRSPTKASISLNFIILWGWASLFGGDETAVINLSRTGLNGNPQMPIVWSALGLKGYKIFAFVEWFCWNFFYWIKGIYWELLSLWWSILKYFYLASNKD